MRKLTGIVKQHIIFIALILIYLSYTLLFFQRYGNSIDENSVYLRGQLNTKKLIQDFKIAKYFLELDLPERSPGKIYVDPIEKQINKNFSENYLLYLKPHYYPYLFVLSLLNPKGKIEVYHLLNMVFFVLLFISSYVLFYFSTRNSILSSIYSLILFLNPRFLGMVAYNPKDIPFAVWYFISLTVIFFSQKVPNSLLRVLILSVVFFCTYSIRLLGLVLFPIYILVSILVRKDIINTFLEVIIIFIISFFFFILFNPFVSLNIIQNFALLLRSNIDFFWDLSTLTDGKYYTRNSNFFVYIIKWYFVTLPLFVLFYSSIGFLASIFVKNFRKKVVTKIFLISLFTNILILLFFNPIVYDGVRHLSYLEIHLYFFSVLGVFYFIKIVRRKNRTLFLFILVLTVLNIVNIIRNMFILFPYEGLYFNEMINGLTGAYSRYETDYWAISYKEAAEWLDKNIKPKDKVFVYSCYGDISYYIDNKKFIIKKDHDEVDYVICWERFDMHKHFKGEIIYSVKKLGVPLSHVIKIND